MKGNKRNIKIFCLIASIIVFGFLVIAIPSLARYKNRSSIDLETVWNGSIAANYRSGSGTSDDPYIISDGSELALFAQSLSSTDYSNTYFALKNDIVLNNGIFSYSVDGGLTYIKDGNPINISPYQDSYSELNKFMSFNNFKGFFNGNFYRIYGAFISDSSSECLGLFNNLQGTVQNLYVENSVIYGGNITGGIASTTSNAVINNTLFNGFVISKGENKNYTFDKSLDDIIVDLNTDTSSNIVIDGVNVVGNITNVKLSGVLEKNEGSALKIDQSFVDSGEFSIDLGTSIKNIPITYLPGEEGHYKISNLKYTVTYDSSVTSGIVGLSYNTSYNGVVNKASIHGKLFSSGLVGGLSGNSTINNSYSTGNISGDISSGLVSYVNYDSEVVNIDKSYNSGNSSSSFIGYTFGSGEVNISNCFSTSSGYALNNLLNTNVNINNVAVTSNSYVQSGTINGSFTLISSNDVKNYAKNVLGFLEYTDKNSTGEGSIWVYNESSLPILYIDDIDLAVARININNHSWNNFSDDIDTLKFNDSITFNIENVDNLKPAKEVYYYISNSKNPLKKNELDDIQFINYIDVVSITEQGFYIVYAKIVDYSDNVVYLNSDLLVIDLSGSYVSVNINNNTWEDFSDSCDYTYINNSTNATITAVDDLSGVKSIKYFISDTKKSLDEIKTFDGWIQYKGSISLDSTSEMNLYVRVEDNCNYITYVNTNTIVIGGYKASNLLGNEVSYVTGDSTLAYNYSFNGKNSYSSDMIHSVIVNKMLPNGAKITIVDLVNGGAYKYIVDGMGNLDSNNGVYRYDLLLFSDVGTFDEIKFKENRFSGNIHENFNLYVDFSNCSISDVESYAFGLNIYKNDSIVISTLASSIVTNYIVPKVENSGVNYNFSSSFNDVIKLNSNSTNNILFNASILYDSYNGNIVYDTNYFDKNLYLAIKLVDSNGNLISRDDIDNLIFKYNDKNYSVSNDGIVRINIGEGVTNGTLSIITSLDNINIANGDYNFKLGVYSSYDECSSIDVSYTSSIPAILLDSNYKNRYGFNVVVDNSSRIIEKGSEKLLKFNVENYGLSNSHVVVSLYEKNKFTAYDQSYKIVDLNKYIKNPLTLYSDKVYHFNNETLKLDTNKFNKNGYMFLFELYNGDKKIEEIRKNIIIR